jgi:hypothetical protein
MTGTTKIYLGPGAAGGTSGMNASMTIGSIAPEFSVNWVGAT